ncbi:MAG: response regulator [Desulfobacteraceae bacterium]|nr:MAG: response regulator [Desulfobacteraceae bacterium]
MKVIVADDSQVMRMIIQKIVGKLGYETIHANNGQEVLKILQGEYRNIDLILLDWNMPVLNGLETLIRIRESHPACDIPILMVSTESEEEKIREAMNAGAGGYIAKPFTADTLSEVIRQVKEKRSV